VVQEQLTHKQGLPEYFKFLFPKKGISLNFGPLGKVKFGKKSSDLIQAAAAIYLGSYMPGGPGFSTAGSAAAYGGVRAAATGNLMEGIQAGLTAYGLGNAYQSLGGSAPPGPSGSPAPIETRTIGPGSGGVQSGVVDAANVPVGAENPLAGMEYINTTNINPGINPLEGSQYINTIHQETLQHLKQQRHRAGYINPGINPLALVGSNTRRHYSRSQATRAGFPLSEFDQAIQDAVYGPGGPGVPADVAAYGDTPYKSFGQTAAAPTSAQIAAQERVLYNPLSDPEAGGFSDLGAPFEYQAVSPQNAAATAPDGFLARNLPAGAQKYTPDFLLDASGTTLAAGTVLGSSLISGQQERAAFAAQQAAAQRAEEEERRKNLALFESTLGQVPTRMGRSGGLMSLAKGGMAYMEAGGTTGPTGVPRDVTGTGDGMSDSVPATIEGVQEARLADGEFVIPADVVADIGNGSSNSGSKKLYDMMDRIRKARHGTTKQPPEINAERMMPA
jgi:hypothetical protein